MTASTPHAHAQASDAPRSRVLRWLRDGVAESLAALPTGLKQWLLRHFHRPLLWLLFRLQPEPITVARVGPRRSRFFMRVSWQSHTDYVLGIYEPEVESVLRRLVRPGACCMDVGAHIGYSAILLSRLTGPRGKVIAYEPFPENHAALEENVRRNGCQNIVLRRLALGQQPGECVLEFSASQELSRTPSAVGYAVEGPRARVTVPMDTLDAEVQRLGLAPRMIKIDVEGAELAVLRGAAGTLREFRPVVLVEIHGWGSSESQEVIRFLEDLGYRTEQIGRRGREVFCLAAPQ